MYQFDCQKIPKNSCITNAILTGGLATLKAEYILPHHIKVMTDVYHENHFYKRTMIMITMMFSQPNSIEKPKPCSISRLVSVYFDFIAQCNLKGHCHHSS